MRIDDRKVKGRIMIDASDVVNGFTIVIVEDKPMWAADATGKSLLDPSVAVS